MEDPKKYIEALFALKGMPVPTHRSRQFEAFAAEEENSNAVLVILEKQKMLMEKWKIIERINDITRQSVSIPNGTVGKAYEAKLDFSKWGWKNLAVAEFTGLEPLGLKFDDQTDTISGTPTQSGDLKILFKFRLQEEAETVDLHEKPIALIINPDPKSLWKSIPSDPDGLFAKPDIDELFQPLGDKHIVVASHRGRSHANVGSYRDDDFAVKHLDASGWSVVAVSDGAGSYAVSRKGSQVACHAVVEFFENYFTPEKSAEVDAVITGFKQAVSDEGKKKLNDFIYDSLSKSAWHAHKQVEEFALKSERPIKDFHSTLIFAIFKKYEFGYVVLSFGVGDCPIAVLYNDEGTEKIMLMNWLDVGEFGGGTRFITMAEIFNDEKKLASRFNCKIFKDFSYLMLMTDGIYDPKFVVEASLEKIEKWKEFIKDLDGNNDDHCKVEFTAGNKDIAGQLSKWMEFWSPGNHDDRTLAIVF